MSDLPMGDAFSVVSGSRPTPQKVAATYVATLTPRQREVMDMVLAGQPSKNIAADLGISQRTVEKHRAAIMRRTGSRSLPALARLALIATWENESFATVPTSAARELSGTP